MRPSCRRLCALASIASLAGRGDQSRIRRAFALLAPGRWVPSCVVDGALRSAGDMPSARSPSSSERVHATVSKRIARWVRPDATRSIYRVQFALSRALHAPPEIVDHFAGSPIALRPRLTPLRTSRARALHPSCRATRVPLACQRHRDERRNSPPKPKNASLRMQPWLSHMQNYPHHPVV